MIQWYFLAMSRQVPDSRTLAQQIPHIPRTKFRLLLAGWREFGRHGTYVGPARAVPEYSETAGPRWLMCSN